MDWKKRVLTKSFYNHQIVAANESSAKWVQNLTKATSIQDPPMQSTLSLPLPIEWDPEETKEQY